MMNNDDFDKWHNSNFRLAKRGFKIAMGLWVLWALFCLSIVGGIIYVAIHFLAKVW